MAWLHIWKMEETEVCGWSRRNCLHSSQLIFTFPSRSILTVGRRRKGEKEKGKKGGGGEREREE